MKKSQIIFADLKAEPTGIIPNGDDFKGIIVVKNTSQRNLTVNVTGVIRSVMYTGETKHLLKSKKSENIAVGAGESKLRIHYE